MALHSTLPFDELHKAKFDAGVAADLPVTPEGLGDAYFSTDTSVISIGISDGLGGFVWDDYDFTAIGTGGVSDSIQWAYWLAF